MSDCTGTVLGTVFLHSNSEGCCVAFGLLVDDQYEEYETKPLVELSQVLHTLDGDADEGDLIAMAIRVWMMDKGAVDFEVVDV